MNLAEKLSEVMAEVGYVQKDATNSSFHKYRYASAEAVLKKVNSALSERGIAVSSEAELTHYDGGHAIVRLSLTFHDGDESLTAQGLGEGSDKGDKATMKANTAALKYALANAFMISWGDDPEADATTDMMAVSKKPFIQTAHEPLPERAAHEPIPEPDPFHDGEIDGYETIATHLKKGARGAPALRSILGAAMGLGWDEQQLLDWTEKLISKPIWDATPAQANALLSRIKKEKETVTA